MKFNVGDRVRSRVHAPAAWDGAFAIHPGSAGVIVNSNPGYGVLFDDDPEQMSALFHENELEAES